MNQNVRERALEQHNSALFSATVVTGKSPRSFLQLLQVVYSLRRFFRLICRFQEDESTRIEELIRMSDLVEVGHWMPLENTLDSESEV
jgi:hypothetical protein